MEIFERRLRNVRFDHRDTACRAADRVERVQQAGIIGAVEARLYDDEAFYSDYRHEGLILSEHLPSGRV